MPKEPNKFRKLYKEGLNGDELQEAIFLLTLQDKETWDEFKVRRIPVAPVGYVEIHEMYLKENNLVDRSNAWKSILKEFGSYLYSKWDVEVKNKSDMVFLHKMLKHFRKKKMEKHTEIVRQRLNEYEEIMGDYGNDG